LKWNGNEDSVQSSKLKI